MSSDAAAASLFSEQDGIFAIKEESKTFSQWKRLSFGKTLVKHRGAPQQEKGFVHPHEEEALSSWPLFTEMNGLL